MNGAKCTGIDVMDGTDGEKILVSHLSLPNAGGTKVDITYTVHCDGSLDIEFNVNAAGCGLGNFIRVGSFAVSIASVLSSLKNQFILPSP